MNRFFTLLIAILMISSAKADAAVSIHFEVSFIEPQAHYAEVSMQVDGISKEYVDIKMPVWTPGSYLVREYAKNIEGFTAVDGSGKKLDIVHLSKNTWRIFSKKADFKVSYRVYAFEISVRTPFVDASHAFLFPAGVFMYPDGMIAQSSVVTIRPFASWTKVSTGLEPVTGQANTFSASNFDILYDSPIEVGNQDVFGFNAGGVRYEVAMYGGGNYNKERIKTDFSKIIAQEAAVFGENPNTHYVFIVQNYLAGGGGLEHLNSCVLGVARGSYNSEAGYQGFLRLVAHEHFHLWNVKRLRPVALGPFDYENENYTTNLWIAEGFTSYYEKLILNHAGFLSPENYLNGVLGDIRAIENQPGNAVQSASEASFDAWIKYYRQNENSKNTTVSYYSKGAVIAALMNLEILQATKGEKCLDDVMRAMYEEYYKKQHRGYTDAEFRAMAEKIAGTSLAKIYDDYVNGTAPGNYNDYFKYAGLRVITDKSAMSKPYLGATLVVKEGKVLVTGVERASAAWDDGLNVNDEVIAIDNLRINPVVLADAVLTNEADRTVASHLPGDKLKFTVIRDGLVKDLDITLKGNPAIAFRIVSEDVPSQQQLIIRRKWLH